MTEKTNIPSYIEELNNGNVKIFTKDGSFELEDATLDDLSAMKKRCKGQETHGILALSIVAIDGEPKKIGEANVGKFKGSSTTKLMQGIQILYGVEDIEELFQNGEND